MDFLKRSGADCSSSSECLDFCIDGYCTEKRPNDAPCLSSIECWGACIGGYCSDMRNPGDPCDS